MSDHFIVVVPRDPRLVPTDEVQRRVVGVLPPRFPHRFNSSTVVRTLKEYCVLIVPPK